MIGEEPDDLYAGLQLTHSGRFCRPEAGLVPRCAARHPILDERFGVTDNKVGRRIIQLAIKFYF